MNKKKVFNFQKQFKNKKVLVTGHTGFKGSWLSLWLKNFRSKSYWDINKHSI